MITMTWYLVMTLITNNGLDTRVHQMAGPEVCEAVRQEIEKGVAAAKRDRILVAKVVQSSCVSGPRS